MEENLQRDGLEDFLKKTFEDFERQPSEGMWDKIAAGMDAPAAAPHEPIVRPISSAFMFRRWHIGLAATLLLGIFGWQHFYFQEKIDGLTEQVEKQKLEQQQLQKNEQEEAAKIGSSSTDGTISNPENQAGNGTAENIQLIEKQRFEENFSTQNPIKNSGKDRSKTDLKDQSQGQSPANFQAAQNQSNHASHTDWVKNEGQNKEQKGSEPTPQNANLPVEKKPKPEKPADEFLKRTDWATIELSGSSLKNPTFATTPKIYFSQLPMIRPARQNEWKIGVQSAVLATRATAEFERSKFPDPKDKGKNVAEDGSVSGKTWMSGIALEKELTRNLSIVSGANFKQTELTSSHVAEFKFKERRGGPGGGGHHNSDPKGDHEHDFNFNLNTGGGSVAVELRVAEVDSNSMQKIDDDEKLKFETTTRQKTQWISVPLALKYSVGRGRLQAHLKAGLAANFLIFNDFNLTDYRVDNKKFEIEPFKPAQKETSPLRAVTFDWLASAGLEYRLTHRLSIAAEPMLVGNLHDYQNLEFAKTDNLSAGLNLGLNYRF